MASEASVPEHNIKLCCNFPELAARTPFITHAEGITSTMLKLYKEKGLYAYSGEHCRASIRKFHSNHPANVFTQGVEVDIFFVDFNSENDITTLLTLGFRANKISTFSKAVSQKTYIQKIHSTLVDDNRLVDHELHGTDWPIEKEYIEHFLQRFNLKKELPLIEPGSGDKTSKALKQEHEKEQKKTESTIRFLTQVGRCHGKEWELLWGNILHQERNESAAPGVQSKISMWWYQPLHSLPRQIRIQIMEAADPSGCGRFSANEIKKAAIEYKSKEKVREAVVTHFNYRRYLDTNWKQAKCFEEVIHQVPKLNNDNLIQPYYFSAMSNPTGWEVPDEFLQKIYNVMLASSNSERAKKEKQVRRRLS